MKRFTKALAAIMLMMAVICAACTKDPNIGEDNNGNGGNGGGGNHSGEVLPAGMYLGVIGFNQQLYTRPITRLDAATIQETKQFIENLTMGGATLLYHSVNTSLDMLESSGVPKDLKKVAIVNFTDGLDEGSYTFSNYNSGAEYLRAITQRIRSEKVGGLEIKSHTIGIQGDDVFSYNMNEFLANLDGISSPGDDEWQSYVHHVTSFDEVSEAFEAIARSLHQTVENAKMTLNPPAPEPNTKVRFTFDITTTDFNGANQSQKYIEGVYVTGSDGIGVLTNVQYKGVSSTSGNTVKAVRMERPFAIFEFEGMANTDGTEFNNNTIAHLQEWKFNTNSNGWVHNTEFTNTGNTEITNNYFSGMIMLNLDCSKSLGNDQFRKLRNYAKDFVDVLKTN